MPDVPTHETRTLNVPIEYQGQTYTELRVRRATARDILRGQKRNVTPFEQDLNQLIDLCEVPPDVVYSLDMSDLIGLQNILRGFARPSEDELRRAIVILSTHVGWDLATLESLPVDDIIEWLKTLAATMPRSADRRSTRP